MDLYVAIRSRRSIRSFQKTPIPKATLERILISATWAPSPMNSQPWSFIVVAGKMRDDLIKIISKYPDHMHDLFDGSGVEITDDMKKFVHQFALDIGGAPVFIIITTPKYVGSHWKETQKSALAMAAQNLMLAAYAENLGTVYLSSSLAMEDEIKRLFDITDRDVSAVIPIGEWEEFPLAPERKPPEVQWYGL